MNDFLCGSRFPIPDDAVLWRAEKVSDNHIYWSQQLKRWVPRVPDALVFNKELSTFWSQHLESAHDLDARSATVVRQGSAVTFACVVEDLRLLHLTVEHDPTSDGPTGCAHVLAGYPDGLTKVEKKRLRAEIVDLMVHDPASGDINLRRPPE